MYFKIHDCIYFYIKFNTQILNYIGSQYFTIRFWMFVFFVKVNSMPFMFQKLFPACTTTTDHHYAHPMNQILYHFFQYFWPYFINGLVNIDLQCTQSYWFVSINHGFNMPLKKII